MTSMIPRLGLVLLLGILTGCGLELLSPIQKLSTSGTKGLPGIAWDVDMKLPLGEVSVSLADPKIAKSVFGDMALETDAQDRMWIRPDGQDIAPVELGDKLRIATAITASIPATKLDDNSVKMPELNMAPVNIDFETLFPAAPPSGFPVPAGDLPANDVVLPFPDSPFIEAQLDNPAGSLGFRVTNHMGMAFTPSFVLFASGVEIGRSAAMAPIANNTDRAVTIPLNADATMTRDLKLSLRLTIPGGQTFSDSATGLTLDQFDFDDVKTKRVKIKLASQTVQSSQSIPLNIQDPSIASSSIKAIRVESGTLAITLNNQFPIKTTVKLSFQNLFRSGQTQPMVETLEFAANQEKTTPISLDGVTIRPENGMILADVEAKTADTGPTGAYFTTDGSQKIEGSVSLQPPLTFHSIEVPLTRSQDIATSSTPINLPTELSKMNLKLGGVALKLHLDNQSGLSGHIDLAVNGKQGTSAVSLTAKDGSPLRLAFEANKAQDLMVDQDNSNLLDVLNAMPKELEFGGKVTIDSGGQPVTLTKNDRISGKVSVEVPLSLQFPAMGKGKAVPAYDIKPATDLALSDSNREQLSNLSSVVLHVTVDNGWKVPLGVDLRFSKQDDPYSDSNAMVQTISLGSSDTGFTVPNAITLTGEAMERFREARKLGVSITSPGSDAPVTLYRSAVFRLKLSTEFKATIDTKKLGQSQ